MADATDYLALYGGDEGAAKTQADVLAKAIRQRRAAGLLGLATGDTAMGGIGKELTGDADRLETGLMGAAQHRGQQAIEQKRYDTEAARMAAQQEHWRILEEQAQRNLELRAQEVGATPDEYGRPVLYRKHGPTSALPRSTGAAGGQGGGGLTADAKAMLARQVRQTGQMMQGVGRGKAGTAIVMDILNQAAAGEPDVNLAGNKAAYKADTSSLGKQQTLLDITKSWENTGKANLGVLRGISHELVNGGSPLANRPLRWVYQNMAGDPVVAKFKAAHAAVVNEYAKILSGSTGGGGVTEGARHEAEQMLPLDATPEQIGAAADILETDAGNRLSALTRQVAETRARAGGERTKSETEAPRTDKEALRKKYGL